MATSNSTRLTADRLVRLGYRGLTRSQADELLQEMYNACEEIVGLKLAKRMSNKQLDAFERFFEAHDDEGAFKWLENNFPDYREIVGETFDELDKALREAAREASRQSDQSELTSRRELES